MNYILDKKGNRSMSASVSPENPPFPGLDQFRKRSYLNLETYRKNGQAVPTPVWFVQDGGLLYVRTFASSGKVKRVRNNSRVRVVPCDYRGKPRGEWVEGQAQLVDEPEAERINQLLKKKYGLVKAFFDRLGSSQWVTLMVKV